MLKMVMSQLNTHIKISAEDGSVVRGQKGWWLMYRPREITFPQKTQLKA